MVTETYTAETQLTVVRQNNYPSRPITEIITNGFFTVDRKWTVQSWNKAAELLLGVPAREMIGFNLWEKFADTLPVEFYAYYHRAFLQKAPVHLKEYWAERETWYDIFSWSENDTLSVSFKATCPIGNAVPAEVRLGDELRSLNELYRYVTEITNDCLWEWDLNEKEVFWIDGGHKRMFGYNIESALVPQLFWENCLHPEDKKRVLSFLDKTIRDGKETLWEVEYRFKKTNGEYAFVHDRGHILYDGNNRPARMIGATHDITQRVELENKLSSERWMKQKEITAAVIVAQENERSEIGKELHDNLNQTLAVAKMYAQMAKKDVEGRNHYLEKSCGLIGTVIEEIRQIAKHLVLPETHITSMVDNIRNAIHDLSKVQPIKIDFTEKGIDPDLMDDKLQVTIFRIVQEQLNNIVKHSNASYASISLELLNNSISLTISDNGDGCDVEKDKKGVGLINIQSRADLYDGRCTIHSKPGEGFKLHVEFPF